MTKVLISLCTHRNLEPETEESLNDAFSHRYDGISLGRSRSYEAMIDRARGMQATAFLEDTDFDMLLFIDADIVFLPKAIEQIVKSVQETGSVVCGPYSKRSEKGDLPIVALSADNIIIGPVGGLVEVRWAPTGFMCIPRQVLEKLASTMRKSRVRADIKIYTFFMPFNYEPPEDPGELVDLSEDFAFCERARQQGFKIWLDTRIQLGHVGSKIFYPK
jgi:hypothetical protein